MENKTKIIYCLDTFNVGGAERLLLDICKTLDRQKFEIEICATAHGGPLETEFKKLGLPVKIFQKKGSLGLNVLWQLRDYFQKQKPDIVHTHLFFSDTIGQIAAKMAKVPLVISTEHSLNLNRGALKNAFRKYCFRFSAKIIAVSLTVKDYLVSKEKVDPEKVAVIYNGVDTGKFIFRSPRPIDLSKKINGAILARLDEPKGHKYLLEAMPLIIQKYPKFILNIVGSGGLENDLKALAKKLQIENNVVFWGQKMEVAEILQGMDMLILPSLWEGLGIVLLEAQAVGVPVLASDIPSVKEAVEDKKTGLLFAPKDPQAIFSAVDKLLSDPALAEKISQNARKQLEEKFTLSVMVGKYEELYFNLIKVESNFIKPNKTP